MSEALRIVSLLPSATELVALLGLGDRLVGRSHECDTPREVAALPACTRSLIEDGESGEIDAAVRAMIAEGGALYALDEALVRELAPTHVVTQAQCDVCAIGSEQVEAMLARGWPGPKPEVIALSPRTLGDVFADLQHLGRALGVTDASRRAVSELADRVSRVGEETGARTPRPRVLCLEWLVPPIAAGNWMPELVRIAGGEPLFGRVGAPSVDVPWRDIAAADPDFVLVMPCGFDLARSVVEARALGDVPEWRALRAAQTGRAVVVDGDAYFNRSGPRLVDSLELLAELLAPDAFDFGLREKSARVWSAV